ncbi:nodulation protein, partial [Bradyrhizobium sp. UFLA05-153]
ARDRQETVCEIRAAFSGDDGVRISDDVYNLLMRVKGEAVLLDLFNSMALDQAEREALVKELRSLWEQRRVRLHPPSRATRVESDCDQMAEPA